MTGRISSDEEGIGLEGLEITTGGPSTASESNSTDIMNDKDRFDEFIKKGNAKDTSNGHGSLNRLEEDDAFSSHGLFAFPTSSSASPAPTIRSPVRAVSMGGGGQRRPTLRTIEKKRGSMGHAPLSSPQTPSAVTSGSRKGLLGRSKSALVESPRRASDPQDVSAAAPRARPSLASFRTTPSSTSTRSNTSSADGNGAGKGVGQPPKTPKWKSLRNLMGKGEKSSKNDKAEAKADEPKTPWKSLRNLGLGGRNSSTGEQDKETKPVPPELLPKPIPSLADQLSNVKDANPAVVKNKDMWDKFEDASFGGLSLGLSHAEEHDSYHKRRIEKLKKKHRKVTSGSGTINEGDEDVDDTSSKSSSKASRKSARSKRVMNALSESEHAAPKTPRGGSKKDRLSSTDHRHGKHHDPTTPRRSKRTSSSGRMSRRSRAQSGDDSEETPRRSSRPLGGSSYKTSPRHQKDVVRSPLTRSKSAAVYPQSVRNTPSGRSRKSVGSSGSSVEPQDDERAQEIIRSPPSRSKSTSYVSSPTSGTKALGDDSYTESPSSSSSRQLGSSRQMTLEEEAPSEDDDIIDDDIMDDGPPSSLPTLDIHSDDDDDQLHVVDDIQQHHEVINQVRQAHGQAVLSRNLELDRLAQEQVDQFVKGVSPSSSYRGQMLTGETIDSILDTIVCDDASEAQEFVMNEYFREMGVGIASSTTVEDDVVSPVVFVCQLFAGDLPLVVRSV